VSEDVSRGHVWIKLHKEMRL